MTMSDAELVARLIEWTDDLGNCPLSDDLRTAAERIERLSAELAAIKEDCRVFGVLDWKECQAGRDRLRAALERYGKHSADCGIAKARYERVPFSLKEREEHHKRLTTCTCGLSEALAAGTDQ